MRIAHMLPLAMVSVGCNSDDDDTGVQKNPLPGQQYELVERSFNAVGCVDAVYYFEPIHFLEYHTREGWTNARVRSAAEDGRTVWGPSPKMTKPDVLVDPAPDLEPISLDLMSGPYFGKANADYRLTLLLRDNTIELQDTFTISDCRRPEFCMPYQNEGCTVRSRSVFAYVGELEDYNRDAESFRDLNPWPEGGD